MRLVHGPLYVTVTLSQMLLYHLIGINKLVGQFVSSQGKASSIRNIVFNAGGIILTFIHIAYNSVQPYDLSSLCYELPWYVAKEFLGIIWERPLVSFIFLGRRMHVANLMSHASQSFFFFLIFSFLFSLFFRLSSLASCSFYQIRLPLSIVLARSSCSLFYTICLLSFFHCAPGVLALLGTSLYFIHKVPRQPGNRMLRKLSG